MCVYATSAAAPFAEPKHAPERWQTLLAGATLPEACLEAARGAGIVSDPVIVQVGPPAALPPALRHRLVIMLAAAAYGAQPAWHSAADTRCAASSANISPPTPPRTRRPCGILFAAGEGGARDAAELLHAAL